MEKPACPFGALFRQERLAREISQWQVVHRMQYYLANIQRIEAGRQHPGVHLAYRLLNAIGKEPGDFMYALAQRQAGCLPRRPPGPPLRVEYAPAPPDGGRKSLFGHFLVQARVAADMSQTAMARAANYSLRNINAVEGGRQDPGIVTALALVTSTGADVRAFFAALQASWREERGSRIRARRGPA